MAEDVTAKEKSIRAMRSLFNNLAFPISIETLDNRATVALGLTKRELISAMTLQGLLANPHDGEVIVKQAVVFADALIKELQK